MKRLMGLAWAAVMLSGIGLRAQDIAGRWQGTMATPDGGYRVVLAISHVLDGGWKATAYEVDASGQSLHDPVPAQITRQDGAVKVTITEDEGSFDGKLSEDGKAIIGVFDGGEGIPLTLVRATAETAWKVEGMPTWLAPVAGSPPTAIQQAMEEALPGPSSEAAPTLESGPAILSDTMGVDFSGYLQQLRKDIQRNWNPLIPAEAQKPRLAKGVVGIRFAILPDGRIGSMRLETVSGDVNLDKAAWYAITSEGQFPALPTAFHGPQLELRVGFFYNTPTQ